MQELSGRTAVVTGAGSGIGRALALALAGEGVAVAVADIIPANAQQVTDEITAAGGKAIAVECDVCCRDSVATMKSRVLRELGAVSLLFANAGATSFEYLPDMDQSDVDWMIQVNLMGVTHCLEAFYPDMARAGDGHVMATASAAGLLPGWVPYHAPYAAAKMGIIGMMLNLRIEAAEAGVGCTVLCPGGVESGMKDNNARYRPDRFGGPQEGGVKIPEGFFQQADLHFRPASEVASLCLEAVRHNRPMVLTDSSLRQTYLDSYHQTVMSAFDELEAFDGQPG
ncbi:SDR family oxidoreductase [Pseudomaricurvus sp. HS19]|uniref:SDR family NAD(P)-dependent oxidoreductase n=1 Tax=Pseudomaricurvus sp. HS19 TaxID=2692626 RepID=UPI0013705816|nr:SDR family oxidoreductase [Pseudomaricurvus sp. HS19]MYM64076.1 SDR family NAD(P)-dependent oxidoreductase [Pseudomaricurvus sp. HS19]